MRVLLLLLLGLVPAVAADAACEGDDRASERCAAPQSSSEVSLMQQNLQAREKAAQRVELTHAKSAKSKRREHDATETVSVLTVSARAVPSHEETQHSDHVVASQVHQEELDEHRIALYIILPLGLALILSLVATNLLEALHLTWLPEGVVIILIGIGLGKVMEYGLNEHDIFNEDKAFHEMCAICLNLVLLPILIFEGGWSLREHDFASQFSYILLFAIFGSFISFLVVGLAIWQTGLWGFHSVTYARTAFAYASLIAATDPVATLGTYSSLKVDSLLNILVFGDSIFNDAVAIVLFNVLNDDEIMGTRLQQGLHGAGLGDLGLHIFHSIARTFGGSMVVGFGVAAVALLVLRHAHMRESPKLVILFLAIVAYVTFAVGEVSGFSGIISTIFASVLLGYYARPHLDHHGSLLSTFFLKQLAHMADICVFLLAGFCVVNLQFEAMSFCLCAAGACLLGRAMGVFPLGVLANAIKSAKGRYYRLDEEDWHLLSKEHLFMMWHAGLRGAIALNLSMQLGPWVDTLDGDGTLSVLQGSTFLIVCLFMLIFGGSTQYFLTRLEIPMGENADFEKLYRTNQKLPTSEFWQWLDQSIMEPFFVGSHVMTSGSRRSVLRRGKDLDILDILED